MSLTRFLRELAALRVRNAGRALRSFYADPVAWVALVVTATVLAYAGGAVMFWFHAIYRGEQGPAISPWYHWLLDSSLGFFGLTPALFLILPAALWILQRTRQGSRLANTGRYVAVVGAIFAAVTGPGPVLHDLIAGRGTWLARSAQTLFGVDRSVLHRQEVAHSLVSESLWQVALGIPVYIALACLGVVTIRMIAAAMDRSRQPVARPATDRP
ncbi:MAG: hypothetical protein QOD01_294 [Actinomycetota bacterium]|nr:hypothetical protein [Actinomycetota bacterium]